MDISSKKDIWDPLSVIKSRLLNQALLVGCILAAATFVFALAFSDYYYNTVGYYLDIISIGSLFGIYLFRHKAPLKVRILFTVFAAVLLFTSSTFQYGTISTQKTLIALIPFLSILVFDFKKTLLIFGGVMARTRCRDGEIMRLVFEQHLTEPDCSM